MSVDYQLTDRDGIVIWKDSCPHRCAGLCDVVESMRLDIYRYDKMEDITHYYVSMENIVTNLSDSVLVETARSWFETHRGILILSVLR